MKCDLISVLLMGLILVSGIIAPTIMFILDSRKETKEAKANGHSSDSGSVAGVNTARMPTAIMFNGTKTK